jgi:peptide/nickel transport system ATP-binding protein
LNATNGAVETDTTPYGRYRPSRGHRDFGFARAGGARRPAGPAAAPVGAPTATSRPTTRYPTGHDVVLDIQNLKTYFFTYDGVVRAIDGINLQARARETTGIVGETGCGKSVTAFSVTRLISEPGMVIGGKVLVNGANLLWGLEREAKFRMVGKSGRVKVRRRFRRIREANDRMSAVRGKRVGMIFQEPSQAMNPVFSISDQLGEAILLHRGVEVLESMLRADAAFIVPKDLGHEQLTSGAEEPAARLDWARTEIDALLAAAATRNQDELRAAAKVVADKAGLPTLATELFYLLRDSGPSGARRRRRVERALLRVHLSGFQRRYLRHLRRIAVMEGALKDLYLREMRQEKAQGFARRRIALRITFERWRKFYLRLPWVKGRLERPLKKEMFWRTVELLEGVRIANPVQVAKGYPHELSGGMLQRTMIAMALSSEPGLLLADEPTTALDVTIQAQILELMRDLRERVGTAIVLITHDLGVVAEVCDSVNVMYAGVVVERGTVQELFRRPLHPYTQGLLASIPRFDQPGKELASIPGSVPNLIHPPPGCRFHPRCPYAMPICREVRPVPQDQGEDHMVACHLYSEPLEAATEAAAEPAAAGPTPVPA